MENEDVLAVNLSSVSSSALRHAPETITRSTTAAKLGKASVAKDLLDELFPDVLNLEIQSTTIKRGVNSCRCCCACIILRKLPDDKQVALRQCKFDHNIIM